MKTCWRSATAHCATGGCEAVGSFERRELVRTGSYCLLQVSRRPDKRLLISFQISEERSPSRSVSWSREKSRSLILFFF